LSRRLWKTIALASPALVLARLPLSAGALAASGTVVINEVDYDQASAI